MILFLEFLIQFFLMGLAFYFADFTSINFPILESKASFVIDVNTFVFFVLTWFILGFFYYSRAARNLITVIGYSLFTVAFLNLLSSIFGQLLVFDFVLYFFLYSVVALILAEIIILTIKSRYFFSEKVLIVGGDNNATLYIKETNNQFFKTVKIAGIIDNNISKGSEIENVSVLGKIIDIENIVKEQGITGVIQTGHFEHAINIIRLCRASGITYKMIPLIAGVYSKNIGQETKDGLIVLALKNTPLSGLNLVLKRVMDILGSFVFMVLFSPIFLLLAFLLKLKDIDAPVFITEDRFNGYSGKRFKMYRFRTLPKGEKERVYQYQYHEVTKNLGFIRDDERASKLGRILRRSKVSELPQLFNVFMGQMSLIGPRPPYAWEVDQYEDDTKKRLLVKPGMTGLWQISHRENREFEDMLNLDAYYVENWNFMMDFIIGIKTIQKVIKKARK